MVHTSTAVLFGALALNAASALATPVNIESNEPLEARAAKGGKSTLSKIGGGLGTAAAFAPIAGLGLSLATGQPVRRDVEDSDYIEARDAEDEDHLEARAKTSTLRKVGSGLGTVAGLAPLAALGLGMATGQPVRRDFEEELYARDVEDNEHLEARGKNSGGKKSTLRKVGSGLGKAAAFAPLAALGLGMFTGQPVRRDLLEELLARDIDDNDHLQARAKTSALRKVGSGLGTVAGLAPLAALGLGMATGQPVRRDLLEELLARAIDDNDHLEARAKNSGLRRVGSGLSTVAGFAPLAALGLGMATGQPVRRDLLEEFDAHLEARAKTSALRKVGSGLGTVAGFAPLAALGLGMATGQPVRRELVEELLARDVDNDHLEARAKTSALRKVGSGLGTVAGFAPLAALGLGMATGQPVRRDLEELLGRELTDVEARGFGRKLGRIAPYAPLLATGLSMFGAPPPVRRDLSEELMDIFHREISESLEDLD